MLSRGQFPAPHVAAGEESVDISDICKSVGNDGFQSLVQHAEKSDWLVHFELCVVVFSWLSEGYCDGIFEMSGTVALFKTCIEEFMKAEKEDIKCLVQDSVGDAISSRGLVRGDSAHCLLNLCCGSEERTTVG
ncbi:hypothetical protein BDBG_16147 [Blastomyces gilchristii SLH14081]|uniref:Uncharacterized protein n=1 Tax=Blastomyces gilchristii (strain SLH14081) TaxID=559298 RepID=A0A179UAB9_BLAGS|nr:uncharacterized protein BDBG_16147 [Blastomyces gilchristii SLH14081]OAT03931.1 hypothetical protein BDBG_16147 [Blastomyces gilchristii SLH14081]